jgi:hypothetical protein
MTWEEYIAAELGSKFVIEAYVQGHQSWWNNKLTLYAQDGIGGYFLYDFPCSEELAAQLTPGTKIRVQGYKAEWAGEVEIVTDELDPDYAKIEIIEGSYVAEPAYVTDLLGKDELVKYQNMLVKFEGLTVVAIEYKNKKHGISHGLKPSYSKEYQERLTEDQMYNTPWMGTVKPWGGVTEEKVDDVGDLPEADNDKDW